MKRVLKNLPGCSIWEPLLLQEETQTVLLCFPSYVGWKFPKPPRVIEWKED